MVYVSFSVVSQSGEAGYASGTFQQEIKTFADIKTVQDSLMADHPILKSCCVLFWKELEE